MSDVEIVDAAMVKHLSDEIARLERENADLRMQLQRSIQVTMTAPVTPATPNYVDTQMLSALQSIQYAVQSMSSSLSMLATTPKD
jgi:hypothetical protein